MIEPIMMNIGMIPPPAGYLSGSRTCCTSRRAPGLRRGEDRLQRRAAGATELLDVTPDLLCLRRPWPVVCPRGASAVCPSSWVLFLTARYEQVGTFNGNPLTMAAAHAMLQRSDDAGYPHLDQLREAGS